MEKKVVEIPATLNRFSSMPVYRPVKKKVAGYARVSTVMLKYIERGIFRYCLPISFLIQL